MVEEYIQIGKILKTQGNHGAVRVLPLTDFPERFQQMDQAHILVNGELRELTIEKSYPHKKFIIIKFKEIQNMNAAEELKGGLLVVTREELAPLTEGSFYIFDLIGIGVYDCTGKFLGKITDVLQTGSNDVYLVETGSKPILIPALKKVVKETDLAGRRMVVELPEGLLD
ncbi:MAG: ribosome maturation factor RimM [Desulfotomaculaceae bacterium]|nr:ribosome maturation factor RimM [Desulfotomaculaceae bacterium]